MKEKEVEDTKDVIIRGLRNLDDDQELTLNDFMLEKLGIHYEEAYQELEGLFKYKRSLKGSTIKELYGNQPYGNKGLRLLIRLVELEGEKND